MLESAVARILNQLLGKYVVHLDTEHLNVGIFSGQVQLTDLKLKPEALYELKLPIKVHAGTIGSIRMQIPWTSLWKQPIIVVIDDILILAKPIIGSQPAKEDHETNKRLLRAFKKQLLNELVQNGGGECNLIGGPHLFSEYLVDNVINNVQLTINNVHVRYESERENVAIGLCIGSITSENTNNKWKPCQGYKGADNMLYHLVKIEALCCYCNEMVGLKSKKRCPDVNSSENAYYEWKNAMSASLQNYSLFGEDFSFFLRPMSIKIKMTINKDPKQPNNNILKVLNDIVIHDLNIHLSCAQYESFKVLKSSFERMRIAWDFIPKRRISNNVWKSYWLYAFGVVLENRVRPYTWSHIRKVRENLKTYSKLYERHLMNPSDTELKLDLQVYEDKLNITNIILARHAARRKFGVKCPKLSQEKSFWDVLPSPERQVLCEHIGYFHSGKEDFIENIYNLRLGNTSLALTNHKDREILLITLTQIICSYQPQMFDESRQQVFAKGCIKIEGCIVEGANLEEHLVPILSSNHLGQNCPAYFFKVNWEVPQNNVEDEEVKCKVDLVLEQMEVVYDKYAFDEIFCFFHNQSHGKNWVDRINVTKRGFWWLQEKLMNFWSLNFQISIPYLVIPETGRPNNKMEKVLILDLGQIKLSTDLCKISNLHENLTQMELEELMYSRFHIVWSQFQVLFCNRNDVNWRASLREKDTELHLIPKTLIKLSFAKCIESVKTLPECKLNLIVQTLKVNLSERNIFNLLQFLDTFIQTIETVKTNPQKTTEIEDYTKDTFLTTLSIEDLKSIELNVSSKFVPKLSKMAAMNKQKSIIILEKCELENNEQWARCVDLPGLEDNISPSNTITTIYRLVINEVQVAFAKSGQVDRPYLSLRLGMVTGDLAMMTYGPACQLTLGNVILTDKLHTTSSGQYLDLIHSQFPSESDTVSVLYRKVSADCPEFQTHFHGVETSLVADLGGLHLNIHQEAIKVLLQYWQFFFEELEKFKSSPNICDNVLRVRNFAAKSLEAILKTSQAPIPAGCVKFSHSFRLIDLTLRILDSDFDILNVHLSGFEADFLFRANERFVFRSYLSRLDVEHLSDASLYNKVLSSDEDKVYELKYVRLAEALNVDDSNDKFSTNGSLKLQVEQIHITLVYKLLIQMQRFVKNLEAKDFAKKIWTVCLNKFTKMLATLENTKRINLVINIKGPVLLIPQSISSPNALIIDTGKLVVENFFKAHQSSELIENILVKLNDVMISRGVFNINGTIQMQETIVEPFNINFDVKRFIFQSRQLKNTWELDGLVENINVTLGQRDVSLLLCIYQENHGFLSMDFIICPPEENDETVRTLEAFFVSGESKSKSFTIKFAIESITVFLYFDSTELLSSPIRDINQGLCQLQFSELNVCTIIYNDSSSDGKLSLDVVNIDELGPETLLPNANKPILYSPLEEYNRNNNCNITVNKPPVIDVTFHVNKSQDKSIDIIVGRLTWILSIPLCEKLALFVLECLPKDIGQGQCGIDNFGYESDSKPLTGNLEHSLTIALRINKPEFQLVVESVQKRKRYFATKSEILCDYSRHPNSKNLALSLSGLHTVYCDLENLNSSNSERYSILRQCDIELSKSICRDKGKREKLTLTISSVYLQFSNKVVHSINDVLNDVNEHFKVPEDFTTSTSPPKNQPEDLWEPKKLTELFTFPENEEIEEDIEQAVHEIFLIPKTELILLLELDTLPVFVLKATLELSMNDWSSLMNSTCELTIQSNYFNIAKQCWEPFIDPVVVDEKIFKPWELTVRLFQDKAHPMLVQNSDLKKSQSKMTNKVSQSDEDNEESGEDMVYLESDNALISGRNSRRVKTSLSTFLDDSSDSENDDGSMEKLAAAISDLFTGDWNESDVSDMDETTDSEPEENPPDYEESVNVHTSKLNNFQKAYYIVLDARETLNFTITPALIKIFNDLLISYTNKTLFIVQDNNKFISVSNDIGPKSRIEVYEKKTLDNSPSTKEEDILLITKTYEKEDSCPNSPTRELDADNFTNDFEIDLTKSLEFPYDFDTINSLDFATLSTARLYEKINRNQMKIYVPGFHGIQTSCPKKDISKLLKIHPMQSNQLPLPSYYIAYKSSITKHGMFISVSSPLQLRNETCFPLSIFYQPSVLQQLNLEPIGDVVNPFETTMRIAVVEPHESYHIPLHVAYHCKLFIQPTHAEGKYTNSGGIWWKDLITDLETPRNYHNELKDTESNDPLYDSTFALRILLANNLKVHVKHNVPNYVIRLLPSLKIQNYLPYALTLEFSEPSKSLKIEPGEFTDVYYLNLSKDHKVALKITTYEGKVYTATINVTPNLEEKVLSLIGDEDQVSISIKAERDQSCLLLFYAPYWIINKTSLPIQIKAASGNFIYHSHNAENIMLFTFKRHGRQSLRVRVYDSDWSSDFGLDCPQATGLIVCKDHQRKKRYGFLLDVQLSQTCPLLTKLVTLLPNFIIVNTTEKKLRFMEHNDKTDLWIDLNSKQSLAFWPETSSMQMYVKFADGKVTSQGFSFAYCCTTLLRIDKGSSLVVRVTGGSSEPFTVSFEDYTWGSAPVLIKNACQDLFLKIQQQGQTPVTLVSPQNVVLYTWDEPTKSRLLFWNIYNHKHTGFVLNLDHDNFCKERINNQNFGSNFLSSSDDSDNNSTSTGSANAKSKRGASKLDKPLSVYWIVYYEGKQRTLLFTQDHSTYDAVYQRVYGELSRTEFFCSLSGISMSLFTRSSIKKEHLHLSLTDIPATWEVNVGHKWKILTLELASWLEDRYKQNNKKCQLKDYVHVDFEKMFMLRPFYAELRRNYTPAISVHVRKGSSLKYFNAKIRALQVDDKSSRKEVILFPLTNEVLKSPPPFMQIVGLHQEAGIWKYIKVQMKDFRLQLRKDLLQDFCNEFGSPNLFGRKRGNFRADLAAIKSPVWNVTNIKSNHIFVEAIEVNRFSIHVSVSNRGSHQNLAQSIICLVFPLNLTPYMPLEGVKHKIGQLLVTNLFCDNNRQILRLIGHHFKTCFLQQYYAQILGLQVLVNPYSNLAPNYESTPVKLNATSMADKIEFSLNCLLGNVNMSSVALEQCITETIGHQNLEIRLMRQRGYRSMCRSNLPPKILNWSIRNFYPGATLVLNQIISRSFNAGTSTVADGETFFKGTGKALLSLVARYPSDDKSNSLHVSVEALKRACLLGEPLETHVRLTRYSNDHLGLAPFSLYESMGNYLLETANNGRFANDTYWTHCAMDQSGRSIILVTLEHVLKVNKWRLWGPWEIEWIVDLDEIVAVPKIVDSKLVFVIRNQDEKHKDDGLRDGQLMVEGDLEILHWLQMHIEQAMVLSMEDKAWIFDGKDNP